MTDADQDSKATSDSAEEQLEKSDSEKEDAILYTLEEIYRSKSLITPQWMLHQSRGANGCDVFPVAARTTPHYQQTADNAA